MLYPAGQAPRETNLQASGTVGSKLPNRTHLQAARCKQIALAAELLLELKALRVKSYCTTALRCSPSLQAILRPIGNPIPLAAELL